MSLTCAICGAEVPRRVGRAGAQKKYCSDECRRVAVALRQRARASRGLPPGDPRHGTPNGYHNYACRCELCTKAWSRYRRQRMHARGAATPWDEYQAMRRASLRHGTSTMYNTYACRCDDCRAWAREERARTRAKARAKPVPEHVHGTPNGYQNYSCRCERCREAQRHDRKRAS